MMTSRSVLTSTWRMASLSEFTSLVYVALCSLLGPTRFNIASSDKSERTSSFPAGWRPSTPTVACWCPAASTCTRASRCPTGAWRRPMTSTREPRRRWPAVLRWSVSRSTEKVVILHFTFWDINCFYHSWLMVRGQIKSFQEIQKAPRPHFEHPWFSINANSRRLMKSVLIVRKCAIFHINHIKLYFIPTVFLKKSFGLFLVINFCISFIFASLMNWPTTNQTKSIRNKR